MKTKMNETNPALLKAPESKLKEALRQKGYLAYLVAAECNTSETKFNRIVNNRAKPSKIEGQAIAAILGTTTKKLFNDDFANPRNVRKVTA